MESLIGIGMAERVIILDTTLRDGDQAAGAAFTPNEKLQLALQLQRLKVDVIEAGFPAASEAEFLNVRRIAEEIKDSAVCAFARSNIRDIQLAGEAICKAVSPRIEVAVPVSDIHITCQLRKSHSDILEMTREAVHQARKFVSDVAWIGVDSTRADRGYLARHMEAAIDAGAATVAIADTVGFATPPEIDALVRYLLANVEGIHKATLAIHCHDDLGMATANTLVALQAGAREVQCTVNGLGERAGNAALEEIVMAVNVRNGIYPFVLGVNTRELVATSQMVMRMSGFAVSPNKAVVGINAFAHGSGMHQDALLKAAETYQIMDPTLVGRSGQSLVIGPHSGRHGLKQKLLELGYPLEGNSLEQAFRLVREQTVSRKLLGDEELRSIALQSLSQNGVTTGMQS